MEILETDGADTHIRFLIGSYLSCDPFRKKTNLHVKIPVNGVFFIFFHFKCISTNQVAGGAGICTCVLHGMGLYWKQPDWLTVHLGNRRGLITKKIALSLLVSLLGQQQTQTWPGPSGAVAASQETAGGAGCCVAPPGQCAPGQLAQWRKRLHLTGATKPVLDDSRQAGQQHSLCTGSGDGQAPRQSRRFSGKQ